MPCLRAQTSANSLSTVVNVIAPEKVVAKAGSTQTVRFTVQVKSGFHVNSNTPSDDYLIPLKLTFTSEGPVQVTNVEYPKPAMAKLQFSTKPVSVFEGDVQTTATIKTSSSSSPGVTNLQGKLRYQACNDRMCLPPRTVEIKVPVEIRN